MSAEGDGADVPALSEESSRARSQYFRAATEPQASTTAISSCSFRRTSLAGGAERTVKSPRDGWGTATTSPPEPGRRAAGTGACSTSPDGAPSRSGRAARRRRPTVSRPSVAHAGVRRFVASRAAGSPSTCGESSPSGGAIVSSRSMARRRSFSARVRDWKRSSTADGLLRNCRPSEASARRMRRNLSIESELLMSLTPA